MKKAFSIILIMVCVLFSVVTVNAAEIGGITFNLSENFTIYTDKDLLQTSSVEGLVFMAISENGNHQIQARCSNNSEFARELKTFRGLDEATIKPVGDRLFPNGYEFRTLNSTVYLVDSSYQNDAFSTTYITVSDGKLYTFTYFGNDTSIMGEFMSSVSVPSSSGNSYTALITTILVAIFIIADIVFLAILIRSFVKDYKRRKMDKSKNIVSQYIKIKRRKY